MANLFPDMVSYGNRVTAMLVQSTVTMEEVLKTGKYH